jgi:uncharacterized protein YnzC (UPF0291/DUF896 family)
MIVSLLAVLGKLSKKDLTEDEIYNLLNQIEKLIDFFDKEIRKEGLCSMTKKEREELNEYLDSIKEKFKNYVKTEDKYIQDTQKLLEKYDIFIEKIGLTNIDNDISGIGEI